MNRQTGIIVLLNRQRGFGFVRVDGGGPDRFFCVTFLRPLPNGLKPFNALRIGDVVDFLPSQNRDKPCARDVFVVGHDEAYARDAA
jgi:cold shock CspA family protein